MESRMGLAVAAAIQTMPVGLAGGSRYRIHSAQRDEGSLGAETLGITASGAQERGRGVWPYSEDADPGSEITRPTIPSLVAPFGRQRSPPP